MVRFDNVVGHFEIVCGKEDECRDKHSVGTCHVSVGTMVRFGWDIVIPVDRGGVRVETCPQTLCNETIACTLQTLLLFF